MIGKVIGSAVDVNRDSDGNVRLLTVEITEGDDLQEIELFRHAGVDYNPPVGSIVVIQILSDAFKVGVAVDDGIEPEAEEGEYEIYSSEGGAGGVKLARVKCDADGNVVCNQGSRLVARKDDAVVIDGTTDAAFVVWIATVSGAINTLAPGTITDTPISLTGKITEGSPTVKVP
jgi:hypothetical protein